MVNRMGKAALHEREDTMRISALTFAALLLGACGSREAQVASNEVGAPEAQTNVLERVTPAPPQWDLQSSGEGAALALLSAAGETSLRLFCPAGGQRLIVNVPAFRPVGSEERLSFGSGGEVVALVADTRGDAARGGVSGEGPVPTNLAALIGGPVAVNYGAQNSGPHPAPSSALARNFVAACAAGSAPVAPPVKPVAGASPCLMQGEERLSVKPLRAVGTEPFWAARIEGRCVTYSHPEDQQGTRIWTHYAASGSGGSWSGALGGRAFELRTRTEPGCSDGMSDKVYPIAVDLMVNGERRRGCAEPL